MYRWTVSPPPPHPKFICWSFRRSSPHNVTVFVDTTLRSSLRQNEVMTVSPNPVWLISSCREEMWTQTHTERPCEDTKRRQSSASQGERLQKKSTLLTLLPQTSGFWNCENIRFCLCQLVCGTWGWQPQPTKASDLPSDSADLLLIRTNWNVCFYHLKTCLIIFRTCLSAE